MIMDQFYEGFNAVYEDDDGKISATGVRKINSKGVDNGLDAAKIYVRLKRLTQYKL